MYKILPYSWSEFDNKTEITANLHYAIFTVFMILL